MTPPQIAEYIFLEKLGSGSFASVYKARKKSNHETVAIKCIVKASLSGSSADNIITEIQILKFMKNPFIVEMKDFLWDERHIYIVMEYCTDGDLSNFIKKRHKLPESICKMFLQQLAIALRYLRTENISHMDLKPQNILLTSNPDLTLKLADFGFAQYLSPEQRKTSIRGSPLYMAPEILLGEAYDARVDLWSVGIIMYECLFGKPPYSSRTLVEIIEKIAAGTDIQIPPNTSISPNCEDLLTRLLQLDPMNRIDFDEFFNHSFIDLEHFPFPQSYEKAVNIVTQAIKFDKEKKYPEAYNLYCDCLQYFIPLLNAEKDFNKKNTLRIRITDYLKRAEELKRIIYKIPDSSKYSLDLIEIELKKLCKNTPALKSAIDIAFEGEQYMTEGQYQIAFDRFQSSLGIIVPLLQNEPKGRRRDLLHQKVQSWMNIAENCKSLNGLNESEEIKEMCCIQ